MWHNLKDKHPAILPRKRNKAVLCWDGEHIHYAYFSYVFDYVTDDEGLLHRNKEARFLRFCPACQLGTVLEKITHWHELPDEPQRKED